MAPRGGKQAAKSRGSAQGGSRAKSRQQASSRSGDRQEQAAQSRDRRRNRPAAAEKAALVDDEDEEIDEDEAFNEEDEMKYGDIFARMKGKRSTGKHGDGDEDDDEDDEDGEDGDEDGEYEEYDDDVERELLAAGGTLLSDLLSGTSATPSAGKQQKGRKSKRAAAADDDDDDAGFSDEYSQGDEEDDDDDDDQGPKSGLLDVVQKLSSQTDRRADVGPRTDVSQLSSSVDISGGLSMDALVGALKDTQGYSGMAQSLLKLHSSATTARPVETVTDARAARKALYAQATEDIAKWQETVAANRSAKTLDLAQDKHDYVRNTTAQEVIKRFKPTSELEQDVEMILVQANAHGPGLDRQEEDELEAAELTLEELKQRRAEIEKARALMTYYQRKRRQINKIKSKTYRKIRKKQKLRQKEKERELVEQTDPELAAQLAEADAVKRLEERMSLRHKNTSKWAKMALARGGTSNESFREALQEQLLLGEELRKRINMERNQSDDEDEDDDDNSDAEVSRKAAVAAAKERLLALDEEDKTAEVDGKYSKLFQMKFMQRKANEQKEQAKRDAQALLEELEALSDEDEDADSDDDDDDSARSGDDAGRAAKADGEDGATTNGESAKKPQASKEEREAAKKRIAEMMHSGSFQMQGSSFGVRVNSALAVQVDRPQADQQAAAKPAQQRVEEAEEGDDEEAEAGEASNPWLAAPSRERKSVTKARGGKKKDEVHVDVAAAVESLVKKNAAAVAPDNDATHTKSKKRRPEAAADAEVAAAVIGSEGAVVIPASKPGADDAATMDGFGKRLKQEAQPAAKGKGKKEPLPGEDPAAAPKKLVSVLSQNELIEMAFVAPDLEDDFRKTKEAEIDDELEITKRKQEELQNEKRGWGTWAGLGAAPMSAGAKRRRDEQLKKLEEEDNKKKMARKDAKMPNVMVSERRVKLASKYKVGEVPHPFTSREQYERAMQMPIGPEWNTSQIVRKHTKPEVITKAGRIIEPITLPKSAKKKAAEAAAKK